jgi:hypothetical protein
MSDDWVVGGSGEVFWVVGVVAVDAVGDVAWDLVFSSVSSELRIFVISRRASTFLVRVVMADWTEGPIVVVEVLFS